MCDLSTILEWVTPVSTAGTFVMTIVSFWCVIKEYQRLRKREKAEVLQHFNERYSSDPNIEATVKRLMKNEPELKDDNIDIIYENEMYMRFFEELKAQVDAGRIDLKEANYMFAYYAKKVDELRNKFVSDYDTESWKRFRNFVTECKDMDNK